MHQILPADSSFGVLLAGHSQGVCCKMLWCYGAGLQSGALCSLKKTLLMPTITTRAATPCA